MQIHARSPQQDHPTGTLELLELYRGGNSGARDQLIEKCLPPFAAGRGAACRSGRAARPTRRIWCRTP